MSLVERCVVGVDVEGLSTRVVRRQGLIQKELDRILDEAAEAAGLPRSEWDRQPVGDGEMAVLPANIDLVGLVGGFVTELDRRLLDHNEDHDPGVGIRLRVAMHTDVVTRAALGFAGPALAVLRRLLDAEPLHRALREGPDENLALLLSEALYQRAVLPELGGLRPGRFCRVQVAVPGTGSGRHAYLRVPRGGPAERPEQRPARSPSPATVLTDLVHATPVRPANREPQPEPPPEPVEQPLAPGVRELVAGVRAALADGALSRADRLTTLALLEQADRAAYLRGSDTAKVPDGLLTELDDTWRAASAGRWGFRPQRAELAGLVLTGRRPFRSICLALGWRADDAEAIPRYEVFVRAADDRPGPFYPTLRNPDREHRPQWHDEWSATAMAVHQRLREWEG